MTNKEAKDKLYLQWQKFLEDNIDYAGISEAYKMAFKALEQEPQSFEWCETCKEYDQENHYCHRWSKAIRDTVEEMKQEYIEREVLDKIRAEIERQEKWLMDAGYNQYNVDIALDAIKLAVDKYKAETEDT